MSVYCDGSDYDDYDDDNDYDEWWYSPKEFTLLNTKRSRRCISCLCLIKPNSESLLFARYRKPENEIEERIYGDSVPLTTWYMCEDCGFAYKSICKLGAKVSLTKGESMPIAYKQLREQS